MSSEKLHNSVLDLTIETEVGSKAFDPFAFLISASHANDLLTTYNVLCDLDGHHYMY